MWRTRSGRLCVAGCCAGGPHPVRGDAEPLGRQAAVAQRGRHGGVPDGVIPLRERLPDAPRWLASLFATIMCNPLVFWSMKQVLQQRWLPSSLMCSLDCCRAHHRPEGRAKRCRGVGSGLSNRPCGGRVRAAKAQCGACGPATAAAAGRDGAVTRLPADDGRRAVPAAAPKPPGAASVRAPGNSGP